MKVLQVLKSESMAGAEKHVQDIASCMNREGLEIEIINVIDESKGGITREYEDRLRSLRSQGVNIHVKEAKNKFDFSSIRELRNIIRQADPDIVHTHMPYADICGGIAAKSAGHMPVISTRHHDYAVSWSDRLRFMGYYAIANRFLDTLIAVSGQVAHQAETYERWPPSSVHVVHHGARDEKVCRERAKKDIYGALNIPDSSALVVSVGRLLGWKGHRYTIRALRHLLNEGIELRWLIAGQGPERRPLESLINELDVQDHINLLGYRDDVPALLSAADIMVHPSTNEAFGIVLIEAMMQGTPIIGTRAGAIPEVVSHKESGYLVEAASSKAISQAVRRLLKNSEERKKMGEIARQKYLQSHTLKEMCKNTIDVYEKVEF